MADVVDAVVDPEGASSAAEAFLARVHGDEDGVPTGDVPPAAPAPPDCEVALPGGFHDLATGEVFKTAEVRELDGEDEEAIAKAGDNFAKVLDTTLQRGVVSVGDRKADKALLDKMLAGDRDALLLAIRRVTFGADLEFEAITCPHCGESNEDVTVSLATDVPSRSLDSPTDADFSLTLKSGTAVEVTLPTGAAQREMAAADEKTVAALNTILLSKCVKKINHLPVVSPQQVRKLKVRERQEIIDAISERTPGPRLGEVTRPCSHCNEDIPVPLSLVALFLV